MKFEHYFEKKIQLCNNNNLHKKYKIFYNNLPEDINQLNHLIIYGPDGIGKYTQALKIIEKYSTTQLKYEKNIIINNNDNEHSIKISDIHYEIDMNILSCNSKTLWELFYNKVIDSILIKTNKIGIILIKHFHNINNDLLDIFYDYMQTKINNIYNIKFIIISNAIGFIPMNIINRSQIIAFSRPSKNCYEKNLNIKLNCDSKKISNINYVINDTLSLHNKTQYVDLLIDAIINVNNANIYNIRENIYNSMFYILNYLINNNYINTKNNSELFTKLINILYYYNNNYRQIFHLERFIVYLINKVNGFK
jgi:hypothetical protein